MYNKILLIGLLLVLGITIGISAQTESYKPAWYELTEPLGVSYGLGTANGYSTFFGFDTGLVLRNKLTDALTVQIDFTTLISYSTVRASSNFYFWNYFYFSPDINIVFAILMPAHFSLNSGIGFDLPFYIWKIPFLTTSIKFSWTIYDARWADLGPVIENRLNTNYRGNISICILYNEFMEKKL